MMIKLRIRIDTSKYKIKINFYSDFLKVLDKNVKDNANLILNRNIKNKTKKINGRVLLSSNF